MIRLVQPARDAYTCPRCERTFPVPSLTADHITREHPETVQEDQ